MRVHVVLSYYCKSNFTTTVTGSFKCCNGKAGAKTSRRRRIPVSEEQTLRSLQFVRYCKFDVPLNYGIDFDKQLEACSSDNEPGADLKLQIGRAHV